MSAILDVIEIIELTSLSTLIMPHNLDKEIDDLYENLKLYNSNCAKFSRMPYVCYDDFIKVTRINDKLYAENMEKKNKLEEYFIPLLKNSINAGIGRSKLFLSLVRHNLSEELIKKYDKHIKMFVYTENKYILNLKYYFQNNPKGYKKDYITLFNLVHDIEFELHTILHKQFEKENHDLFQQTDRFDVLLDNIYIRLQEIGQEKTVLMTAENINSLYNVVVADTKFIKDNLETENLDLLFNIIAKKAKEIAKNKIDFWEFWGPLEYIFNTFNIFNINWKFIPIEKYSSIINLTEFNVDGYGVHKIILENHCLIQQFRIPLMELPTLNNIIKLAFNIGYYKGLTNKHTEFNTIFQYIEEKDIIEESKYISDEFIQFIIAYLYK